MMKSNQGFEVVYNLYEFADGVYLPNAHIVTVDADGLLTYIQQKALDTTIGAFSMRMNVVRERLFAIHELLLPKTLEEKYTPAKKKAVPLETLLTQEETAAPVRNYIHRLLHEWLQLVVRNQLPLSWGVERKTLVKDHLLEYVPDPLEPELYFKKNPENVVYQLKLRSGPKRWTISKQPFIPLTNNDAWLVCKHKLYRLAHINGNMIKPFLKKDEVLIPQKNVNAYFRQFILRIAAKVEFEAEGFEMLDFNRIRICRLSPVQHLFGKDWVLSVQMGYHQAFFNWADKRDQRLALEIDDQENVRILRVKRDKVAESIFIAKLKKWGLAASDGSYFAAAKPSDDPYQIVQWLSARRKKLEEEGFEVESPEIEGKTVSLYKSELEVQASPEKDWFDLHGQIRVGEHVFPFMALARYIREGNRFFPLPDGSFFLIPLEWMTRYRELTLFARFERNRLKLAKSQYTLLENLNIESGESLAAEIEDVEYKPSSLLQAELRPYQVDGVKWLVQLASQQLGACLADDMGLGKTLQTIAVLTHAKDTRPAAASGDPKGQGQLNLFEQASDIGFLQPLNALIIMPASLVFNWEAEIRRFAPALTVYNHTGPRRHQDIRIISRFDMVLTTYQTALKDVDLLEKLEYEYIILDESQQIKNKESKLFHAVNRLKGRHKVSLSGTPIENSLSDLWSQMRFINPDLLGSFQFFKREFMTPIERHGDEDTKVRLRSLVRPYLLRRTKEEVAPDLPPLTTKIFYSEMTADQKKLYEKEKSAARNQLLEQFSLNDPKYRLQVLQTLTRLRQLVNHPQLVHDDYNKESGKFTDVLEHWDLIRKSGHKALFFSSFVQYLELFKKAFEHEKQPFSWLTGDLTAAARKEAVRRFETDPAVASFLISIKAGGTGLNLTAADYVFILDPWWNPTTEQQAIARAHRIGQEKNVIAVKFITRDSIEEKIVLLQEKKSQLAEDIIGNTGKMEFTRSDIEFLLA